MKIAVIGASGTVGTRLCERLYFENRDSFCAMIHRAGVAGRLARLPIEIQRVDVLRYEDVRAALAGCDVVVNCVRGGTQVMLKGLENMARAARSCGISRFVHLSSVAIYGLDQFPEGVSEAVMPRPAPKSYGELKVRQDELVFKLHGDGIPAMIFCPGNIHGPFTPFTTTVVQNLLSKRMYLVDGGVHPTNAVHVDNLVEAILIGLRSRDGWGERYFVTTSRKITWREFYERTADRLGIACCFESVPRDVVVKLLQFSSNELVRMTLVDSFKVLLSGEFRNALSQIPLFKALNQGAYEMFQNLNPRFQERLRQLLERPTIIRPDREGPDLTHELVRVQVRGVFHPSQKIVKRLGYRPRLSFEEEVDTVGLWCEFANFIGNTGTQKLAARGGVVSSF